MEVEIILVGDVSGARDIEALAAQKGRDYMFRHVAPVLQAADLTFGNFECAIECAIPTKTAKIEFHPDEIVSL